MRSYSISYFGYFHVVICLISWYITLCFIEKVFTPPAKNGEEPFQTDNLPENLGYHLKMKDGVVHVYPNEAAASKDEPKPLPYLDMDTFLDDMNFLLALIAQGPVWVFSDATTTGTNTALSKNEYLPSAYNVQTLLNPSGTLFPISSQAFCKVGSFIIAVL